MARGRAGRGADGVGGGGVLGLLGLVAAVVEEGVRALAVVARDAEADLGAHLGLYPIVTLEKQRLILIGNLV